MDSVISSAADDVVNDDERVTRAVAGIWLPAAIVVVLMLLFAAWFSAYSIRKHDALLTYKADLGQMDQAIWNTSHGRILQEVKGDQVSTRLTDHVEPIFLPVSLVFYAWDDVRALLVLQAVLLAAGAWPLYLFARRRLSVVTPLAGWGAAAFVAAYLLAPSLQAATVGDFHALPLAVPFIAASLWTFESRRLGWFAFFTLLVAATQEGAALLTVTLGLYAAIRSLWPVLQRGGPDRPGVFIGLAVAVCGLAWFCVATFVIIPRHALEAYGINETPYSARYGALGGSFSDVVIALLARPLDVLRIAAEPLRVQYLLGLLLPVAGLALLAPELLLVSLPLLLANLLSSYQLQYSGELHYSAALVPLFTAAGVIGAARLLTWLRFGSAATGPRLWLPAMLFVVVVARAVGYQQAEGFAPLGREFYLDEAGGWPRVTEHDRLLAHFAAQIPPTAALSTTPPVYPHFSHRQYIYQFPTVADADYVFVDVSGKTDAHPSDVKLALDRLVASGEFGVLDAADGYLLLRRGAPARTIPAEFYDFIRPRDLPQRALSIPFGDSLTLTGYSVEDRPKFGLTRFRFYWHVSNTLPLDTTIGYEVRTRSGSLADDSVTRPLPALLWKPPAQWEPGKDYVIETLEWYLPPAFAPLLAVEMNGQRVAPAVTGNVADVQVSPEGHLRLPAYQRRDGEPVTSR